MLFAAGSDSSQYVDLDVPVWGWVGLLATIALMLAIDLYRHREAHAPSTKEAVT